MRDENNLLDPRHPQSPYNRYNYNSPYSVINPTSPYYDPEAAKINAVMAVVMVFAVPVYLAFLAAIGLFLMQDNSPVRNADNPNMINLPVLFGCFVLAVVGALVTRAVCCRVTAAIVKRM